MDIVERATKIFDKVIVAVLNNPAKQTSFTVEERVTLLKRATEHLPTVEINLLKDCLQIMQNLQCNSDCKRVAGIV